MGVLGIVFWMFVIVGFFKCSKFNRWLDGLATVPSIMAFFTLSTLVYVVGHIFSNYFYYAKFK